MNVDVSKHISKAPYITTSCAARAGACAGGGGGAAGRVVVRGGMYEVSLPDRLGRSLYWSGEQFSVCRGAWFHDGAWEPLEEAVADAVESEHRRLASSGAWSQADPRAARQGESRADNF